VRNRRTGCLRADPILDEETLVSLYRASAVTYEAVAGYTVATYMRYLDRVLPLLPDRRGVLEIGCGHGFFLEKLVPLGFERLAGIEPSREAVAKAPAAIGPGLVCGTLGPDTFSPDSFSLVCGFQVLDHLARPNEVLQACRRVLVPDGVTFWICHDVGALVPRLLGRVCPIIDIEHTVLYDRRTIRRLFERNGFKVLAVGGVRNRYPLSYWARLAPLPRRVKQAMVYTLTLGFWRRWTLTANLGNLYLVALKERQ